MQLSPHLFLAAVCGEWLLGLHDEVVLLGVGRDFLDDAVGKILANALIDEHIGNGHTVTILRLLRWLGEQRGMHFDRSAIHANYLYMYFEVLVFC